MSLSYPNIDPVALSLGPLHIRWYSLSYIAGILLGWRVALKLLKGRQTPLTKQHLDDFIVWATMGIILGGRLGYILFYQPQIFVNNPIKVFYVWEGGMSFHGGMLGVIVSAVLFAYRIKIPLFSLTDVLACVAPIGLFFGRIANFINGELFGRPTDVAWAMVFPGGGGFPRHPSQIYESLLEGVLLFIILYYLATRRKLLNIPGVLSGLFLMLYGVVRIIGEMYREPDFHLGFIVEHVTMGQILSLPMIAAGGFLVYVANRQDSTKRD